MAVISTTYQKEFFSSDKNICTIHPAKGPEITHNHQTENPEEIKIKEMIVNDYSLAKISDLGEYLGGDKNGPYVFSISSTFKEEDILAKSNIPYQLVVNIRKTRTKKCDLEGFLLKDKFTRQN